MARPENLTAYVEKEWVRGPSLEPADALRAWLEAGKNEALVRVPVAIARNGYGEHVGARLGALQISLDDTALGISLVMRVRTACRGSGPCTVWLEGRWRGEGTFRVLHFDRALAPEERADFVEVEKR